MRLNKKNLLRKNKHRQAYKHFNLFMNYKL